MRKLMLAVIAFLVIAGASADLIDTGSLNPAEFDLCGSYPQYATLTAKDIFNMQNVTLSNVQATLVLIGSPGISYITPQTQSLGSIAPLSEALVEPSWTIQCNAPVQGTYKAYIDYATSAGPDSSLGDAEALVHIHTSQPFLANISVVEDMGDSYTRDDTRIGDSTPTIRVYTTRDASCKGSLDNDEPYDTMDFIFYGLGLNHNYTFIAPIDDGSHSVYVRCRDQANNVLSQPLTIRFTVDTNAPVITVVEPGSRVVGDFAELKVTVNEDAECRWEEDEKSFNAMDEFDEIQARTFTNTFPELDEETYTVYVRCRDDLGTTALKVVEFDVIYEVEASIYLSHGSPLKEGTYDLTLKPSKKLRSTPMLSYTFTDDPASKRDIGLVKDGSVYTGYLIIEPSDRTRQGVFSFQGTDLEGIEGTQIAEGAVFLVDTIDPAAPATFQAEAGTEGITLRWYYEGEDPDHFNIYRSGLQGVGPLNYYDETRDNSFVDREVSQGQAYYYRIAAVDKAGNLGALSSEVSVYAKQGESTAVAAAKNLPTQQTRDDNEALIKELQSAVIDLDWAADNLAEQASRETAVKDLSLEKTVITSKESVTQYLAQLQAVDYAGTTDEELRNFISTIRESLLKIRKTTPESVEVDDKTAFKQTLTADDITLAAGEFLKTGNFSEGQTKTYISKMRKLNEKFSVETELKTLTVRYLDDSMQTRMMVDKDIYYDSTDGIEDAYVVEVIPKTVAGDASGIDFRTPDSIILNPDPVILWHLKGISFTRQEIKYIVGAGASEEAKGTRTVLFLNPAMQEQNLLTGFSIFEGDIKIEVVGVILGIFIILGLLSYYLFVVQEVDIKALAARLPKIELKGSAQKNDPIIIKGPALGSWLNPRQYFYAKNGDIIRSINELGNALGRMDNFTYFYHVHDGKNDFADWIEGIYLDASLAARLRAAKTKQEMLMILGEKGEGQ